MTNIFKSIPKGAIKIPIPDTRQIEDYTCGASALQAVCGYYGVGPEEEYEYVKDMKMGQDGSDPEHICRAAKKYGLHFNEIQPMSINQLKKYLMEKKPVIIMIQAWKENPKTKYKNDWEDGHWVVAIGFDKDGVYFEDPSLAAIRGFIKYNDLEIRWHDVAGKNNRKVDHYGLVIWKPGLSDHSYTKRARFIE